MAHAERVVIAAGSGLLRAANSALLRDAGFDVVAEAADSGSLLRKTRAHRPDIAIVDGRGAARFGEPAAAVLAIRAEARPVAVLVLADDVDHDLARALTGTGAQGAGYLLDRRVGDLDRYVRAIREVAAGGSVLDPEVVTRLVARDRVGQPVRALGEHDRAILAQIAAGVTNRGIAQRMFLSERAIERHVTSIFGVLSLAPCRRDHRRVLAALAYLRAVAA
jgi:DNA-binding NarL/FixJ family response regulator